MFSKLYTRYFYVAQSDVFVLANICVLTITIQEPYVILVEILLRLCKENDQIH